MVLLIGVAFSGQAASVNLDGVLLKGSTHLGPPGSISHGIDLTSSTGNVDWVFFGVRNPNTVTAEVYAANEKASGSAFSNFKTTWEDPDLGPGPYSDIRLQTATARPISFLWDDGTTVPASDPAGSVVNGFKIDPNPFEVRQIPSDVFEFDVLLQAPAAYRLVTYASDIRTGTQLHVTGDGGTNWHQLSAENNNDYDNQLRTHTVVVTNLTTTTSYTFKLRAQRQNNSTVVGLSNFAGMSLERTTVWGSVFIAQ